jgi:hypothetical protein
MKTLEQRIEKFAQPSTLKMYALEKLHGCSLDEVVYGREGYVAFQVNGQPYRMYVSDLNDQHRDGTMKYKGREEFPPKPISSEYEKLFNKTDFKLRGIDLLLTKKVIA